MAQRTYTYNEPWTAGFDRLANTVYQIMQARNQKAALEQQSAALQQQQSMEKLKSGWDMLTKTVNLAKDPNIHPNIKKSAIETFNSTAQQFGIKPLPSDIDFSDESFNTLVKQMAAVKGQVEKGSIGLGDVPGYFNMMIDDANSKYGAGSPSAKAIEGAAKRYTSEIANKRFSEFQGYMAEPKSLAPTPEGQSEMVRAMAGNLSQIDPDLAQRLSSGLKQEKDRRETMKEQYIGPSVDNPGMDVWATYDDYGHGITMLKPSAGQALPRNIGRTPASEINRGITLDTIMGNIGRIRQNYKSDYVGPVAGRVFSAKEAMVGLPEDQSMFYADTRDIADMLLRARSGAQINEEEYRRLSRLVPTPNLPPKAFEARLKRFEEQLAQVQEAQRKRLSTGGYLPSVPSKPVPVPAEMLPAPVANSKKVGRFTVEVE